MARKFLNGIDNASQKIVHIADGSVSDDAASYGQVLNLVNGKDYKDGVVAASTANVTISGPGTTIDGVTLNNGDRVLLKNQTTTSQNGIWVFNGSAAALTRPADFPTGSTGLVTQGATVVVDGGTANIATQWTLTTTGAINVDTTALTFTETTGPGASISAGNSGISVAGTAVSAVAGNGITISSGIAVDRTKVPNLFAATIGDGSTTSIVVTHNLGTLDTIEEVYVTGAGGAKVDCDIQHTSTNTTTFIFAVAPASNAYRVVIFG